LSLAAIFKTGFTEYSNLLNDIVWLGIWIRRWEDITVVKEYNCDSFNMTFMNSKSDTTSDIN